MMPLNVCHLWKVDHLEQYELKFCASLVIWGKKPKFPSMLIFIPALDTFKMKGFQIQQGQVW